MILDEYIKNIESDLESLPVQPADYKIIVRQRGRSCFPEKFMVFYVRVEFEKIESYSDILEHLNKRGYEILSIERARERITICMMLKDACLAY
ncbi:MAG: hypothetical protein QIT35_gp60 [Methanophagales virus PBV299]|uniref:Uncharacterized protein n=1 Tax=Methanophagales virus PBV299 TaxID=2987730 RepID=A0ABY6GLV0_9CAUD|nr:MAG: hypothetical protein QIT35_gp60 [Methanophagales virus PBV299]UYL64856.1 MAG: hypothetical protein OFDIEDLO_00060 [Methanophagales virus PBV299]